MRIVSLVPSSTETLLALGADVVACTRFCEQPHLAHVGGTKNPDLEAIRALNPELVVLDREENRVEDHDELVASGIPVFVSDVRTVGDALDVVGALAAAVGVPEPAPTEPAPTAPAPDAAGDGSPTRRRAFVPIWRRPWMTIAHGTYGGSVLDRIGIDLVGGTAGVDYPTVELGDIAAEGPELVLVPSEPYDFTAVHVAELADVFPEAEVHRVDGRDLFWWGVRTPGAIARLSRVLAPPPMR